MVFVLSWWGIVTNALKMGCESLVAKGIDLGSVLVSQVRWIGLFCLGSKIDE